MLNSNLETKCNINEVKEGKKIVAMNKKFKTICFVFEEGNGLPNHRHNGYASIFVYEGKVNFEFIDGEKIELNVGDYMPFDARMEHNVIAQEKSKVLVTISEALT